MENHIAWLRIQHLGCIHLITISTALKRTQTLIGSIKSKQLKPKGFFVSTFYSGRKILQKLIVSPKQNKRQL